MPRVATFGTVVLSLSLLTTVAAPAFAAAEPAHISLHRHVTHGLVRDSYAGPVAGWRTGPDLQAVPGRGINGASCDLPSSGCPDNDRMTN